MCQFSLLLLSCFGRRLGLVEECLAVYMVFDLLCFLFCISWQLEYSLGRSCLISWFHKSGVLGKVALRVCAVHNEKRKNKGCRVWSESRPGYLSTGPCMWIFKYIEYVFIDLMYSFCNSSLVTVKFRQYKVRSWRDRVLFMCSYVVR